MLEHVYARELSEKQFFKKLVDNNKNYSNKEIIIKKGEINNEKVVSDIIKLSPDLIICYGSSIINSSLLDIFKNKFINVHLGISPYYRGSGTNVWPMINNEFDLIGATFMFIDSGIDTGKIIHQIRADIKKNDDPHLIGNRLKKMTKVYRILVSKLMIFLVPNMETTIKGKLYLRKDFDKVACKNFMIILRMVA